jgi:hypothetical protein
MGFIRTIFGLLILLIIIVFGYWLYASYATAPDAPYWAQINANMPEPLRRWSCEQVKGRVGSGAAPESCEGYW